MTRKRSILDIANVYCEMKSKEAEAKAPQSTEVVEEKVVKKLETFPKATDKKINTKKTTAIGSDTKAFFHKNSGPEAAEGFNPNIIDPKTAKTGKKENHYQPQKFSSALEKTETTSINNNMSNKSIFDKLYEDVMKDDALDLGIQAGPEGDAADKTDDLGGGEESSDVTLTLPRDVAQKLHDLLVDVLGADEEPASDEDAGADDLGLKSDEDEQSKAEKEDKKDEDKKDEDQEEVAGEATELEELPDSKGLSLTGKNNKVPGKLGHAKGGKASGDVKGVTVDGKPSALPDSKGHSLTSKNNKVNAPGYKAGDFFK